MLTPIISSCQEALSMWIVFAFASALFAGLTAVLAKVGIQKTDSNLATALRTVVVLIFSWVMVYVTGAQSSLSSIDGRSVLFLTLSGLATGASWLCYFRALQLGSVSKVAPIDKSSTVLTMLLAFLFLGEALTVLKGLCMLLILAGTLLMLDPAKEGGETPSKSWIAYAILSAVFASLTAILGKIGIQDINSTLGTALRTVVVLVMAWLIVFIQGKQKQIRDIDGKSWLFLILSGIATGASWLCYYRALQTGPASIVVPIDKLSILVTIGFACLFLREKLSARSVLGLVCITGGTLLLLL